MLYLLDSLLDDFRKLQLQYQRCCYNIRQHNHKIRQRDDIIRNVQEELQQCLLQQKEETKRLHDTIRYLKGNIQLSDTALECTRKRHEREVVNLTSKICDRSAAVDPVRHEAGARTSRVKKKLKSAEAVHEVQPTGVSRRLNELRLELAEKDTALQSLKPSHKLEVEELKREINDLKQELGKGKKVPIQNLEKAEEATSNAEADVGWLVGEQCRLMKPCEGLTEKHRERELISAFERAMVEEEDRMMKWGRHHAAYVGHFKDLELDQTAEKGHGTKAIDQDSGMPSSFKTATTKIKSRGHRSSRASKELDVAKDVKYEEQTLPEWTLRSTCDSAKLPQNN